MARNQLMTTDEWVESLPDSQKIKYTYQDAVYTGTDNNIEITCPEHGNFWQRAYIHKRKGAGCPVCWETVRGDTFRHTKEDFIAKTLLVEEIAGKYDYSLVEYKNSIICVDIVCPKHGKFSMTPGNHLSGKGCQQCFNERRYLNNISSVEEFISKATKVQKQVYDYSEVVYKTCKDKVKIICPIHGPFLQTPDSHCTGSGCQKCMKSGFNVGKPGYLYVLTDNITTKVGITNRSASKRAEEVSKRGGPKLGVIAAFYFQQGQLARNLETACHKYLASLYQPVDATFDGSTECFTNVDIPALLAFVTPLAAPNPELV